MINSVLQTIMTNPNRKSPSIHVLNTLEMMRKNAAALILAGEVLAAENMIDSIKDTMENFGLSEPDLGVPTIDGLTEDERSMASRGMLIDAIKSVRSRTNLGLKEAKDVVEAFRHKNPAAAAQ